MKCTKHLLIVCRWLIFCVEAERSGHQVMPLFLQPLPGAILARVETLPLIVVDRLW